MVSHSGYGIYRILKERANVNVVKNHEVRLTGEDEGDRLRKALAKRQCSWETVSIQLVSDVDTWR